MSPRPDRARRQLNNMALPAGVGDRIESGSLEAVGDRQPRTGIQSRCHPESVEGSRGQGMTGRDSAVHPRARIPSVTT
jgi:hypothetical protein